MKTNFKNFSKLWLAGLISAVGNGFIGYGLSVWVYLQTGEVSKYSMVAVVTVLPGILIGFFAGVLVDFLNRKKTLLLCDSINCLLTLLLFGLLHSNILKLVHIYIILSLSSTFASIRWSAYTASIILTVDQEDLKKANGMEQFTNAIAQIFPPIFAAIIVNSWMGISSVILIAVVTYIISIVLVSLSSINYNPPKTKNSKIYGILIKEFKDGVRFILNRKGLMGLLAYMAILNYISGGVTVLFSPMILGFASKYALSIIMAIAGLGMVFGSLLVIVFKRFELNSQTILKFSLLISLATMAVGAVENIWVINIAVFIFSTSVAIAGSAFQYIFQQEVPINLQGRVFSVRKTVVTSTLPLSYISLGYLADKVFIPIVNNNKFISNIFGSGNSRGIGLLLVTLGLTSLIVLIVLYYKLDIRKLGIENNTIIGGENGTTN